MLFICHMPKYHVRLAWLMAGTISFSGIVHASCMCLFMVESSTTNRETFEQLIHAGAVQADCLKDILQLWRNSTVVLLDEVDMLLQSLKSELNFPIGTEWDLFFATSASFKGKLSSSNDLVCCVVFIFFDRSKAYR